MPVSLSMKIAIFMMALLLNDLHYSSIYILILHVSDFIWPFLRPYMGVIPNPKRPLFSQFHVFLSLIFPILIKYFPKCEGKGSFLQSQIKSLHVNISILIRLALILPVFMSRKSYLLIKSLAYIQMNCILPWKQIQ